MRKKSPKLSALFSLLSLAIVGLLSLIIAFAIPVFASGQSDKNDQQVLSDGEYFVTIYDREIKTTIKTSAATVGEALSRANINTDASDIVEPSQEEEITSNNFRINIYRARPVVVIDGLHKIRFMTAQTDPTTIALTANIALRQEDVVKITTKTDFLETGIAPIYEVQRARALQFNFYGALSEIYTQATTVAGLLEERDIKLVNSDWLSADLDTKLSTISELAIFRQGANTITINEEINFTTQIAYDYDRPVGYKAVTKKGENGKKTSTYEIIMQDGIEQSRTLIASIVTKEPIQQVETIGAKYNSGSALTKAKGVNHFTDSKGVTHRETYYDLNMTAVMCNCGQQGYYAVRSDDVKVDRDGYVIVAAHLGRYPRCSIIETSVGLAKVYDTGGFTSVHPDGVDIATDWTRRGD